jgi:hypothetical protein
MTIPASAITEISYGEDVHRRVGAAVPDSVFTAGLGAPTASSRSRKHLIGITWANGDQKGGLAMQCDENDYRRILAALEDMTGLRVVNSEAIAAKN